MAFPILVGMMIASAFSYSFLYFLRDIVFPTWVVTSYSSSKVNFDGQTGLGGALITFALIAGSYLLAAMSTYIIYLNTKNHT